MLQRSMPYALRRVLMPSMAQMGQKLRLAVIPMMSPSATNTQVQNPLTQKNATRKKTIANP